MLSCGSMVRMLCWVGFSDLMLCVSGLMCWLIVVM